jgi:hypothetical protein
MGLIMGSQNIMGLDYGNNISVVLFLAPALGLSENIVLWKGKLHFTWGY